MSTFGTRLKALRLEKGLTQEELGKQLGKTKNNISQYERDARQTDDETKKRIAEIFNVSIDYLLGVTDEPHIYRLDKSELPKPLKDVGVNFLDVTEYIKKHGFTKKQIDQILKDILPVINRNNK